MNRLTKGQREKTRHFIGVADCSEKHAIEALRASDWNLQAAFEYYFNNAYLRNRKSVDTSKIEAVFLMYKDANEDAILADGIMKICEDLGVEAEDIVMLVVAWHLQAAYMGEFTREEFVSGMSDLGVESIAALKEKLPTFREELKDDTKFRKIYNYAFTFARDKGHKSLMQDTAIAMWRLVFGVREWSLLDDWCEFLGKNHNKAISRDTWTQLLEFVRQVKSDFSNYDMDGAWPYLIDEFVEYVQEKKGQQ